MLDFPFNDPTCEKIFKPSEDVELALLKNGHPMVASPARTPWAAMANRLGAELETPSSPLLTRQERAALLDKEPFAAADFEFSPPAQVSGLGSSTHSACPWSEQPGCLPMPSPSASCSTPHAWQSWEASEAVWCEPMFDVSNLGSADDGLTAEPVNEIVAVGLDFGEADASDKAYVVPTTPASQLALPRSLKAVARRGAVPRHVVAGDAASIPQSSTTPLVSASGGAPLATVGQRRDR